MNLCKFRPISLALCSIYLCANTINLQAAATTITVLSVSADGKLISSGTTIPSASLITLSATVKSGSTGLTTGQVKFCDASAKYCTGSHVLGIAQLNKVGTATLRFHAGIGSRSYNAIFLGTNTEATSTSAVVAFIATGTYPTTTTITQSGTTGNYTLDATVTGSGNHTNLPAPTGKVSFIDSTSGNQVLATSSLGTAVPELAFPNSGTYELPDDGIPESLTIADFNGDGIPDSAFTDLQSRKISILLGRSNGIGTLAQGSPFTVGTNPYALATGDFNQDGIPDLAVGSAQENTLRIVIGVGDGTFIEPMATTPTPINYPTKLVTGDFNNDGIDDLAVLSASDHTVTILLGKGDGTFAIVTPIVTIDSYPTGEALSVAVADFNRDGKADLAVSSQGEGTVTILLGNGNGTFAKSTQAPLPVGTNPYDVKAGDFNGDGIWDLASLSSNDGTLSIFLGAGNGTFTPASGSPISVYVEPESVAVGDFNGDGIDDLVLGGDDYGIGILQGIGDGTFTSPMSTIADVGFEPDVVGLADVNGDGLSDIIIASTYSGTVSTLFSFETQTSTASVAGIDPLGSSPHQVSASYPGDSRYSSSNSDPTALTVQVLAPVISPGSGALGLNPTIVITDATSNATIYYSVSGTQNTNGFVQYTGPIKLTASGAESIDAYATEIGFDQSLEVYATYVINLPATAVPTLSLAPGSYAAAQVVTVNDAIAGATIYYTTNGRYPTTSSAKYTGPIQISTSETLQAVALATGYSVSDETVAQYIIGSSPASLIYTVAGNEASGYTGDGGPATSAELNYPSGTVLDSAGNLYIADSTNNVVRKVAVGSGIITTVVGTGIPGDSGDGKAATSAQLDNPTALAVDVQGNLYIADSGNLVIRKVTTSTGVITTFAGNGKDGFSGDGGPATQATFDYPSGVAVDSAGNVYIADESNQRIRKVQTSGIITTVAGTGQVGHTGDGQLASNATLSEPQGIAVDEQGNLYIADSENNVIRKVAGGNGIITTVAGNGNGSSNGQAGYSGDGGLATSAELNYPKAVTVDGAGDIYIADTDNLAIRKVTSGTGIISTVAGTGSGCSGFVPIGGPATSTDLCYPSGLSVDKVGDIYIADVDSGRILEVTATSLPPTTRAAAPKFSVSAGTYAAAQSVSIADGTPGAAIFLTFNGSIPIAVGASYDGPVNVSGNVTLKAIAVAPGYLPSAVTTGGYIISAPPVSVIKTIAGSGVEGISGPGAATSAKIGDTGMVASDSSGNIYFADTANSVIWKVTKQTGVASVIAGNGTPNYGGDGEPAIYAELRGPQDIAIDKAGNVYISDSDNNRVRKVTAATGIITTIAGNGTTNYSGDDGPAVDASLYSPSGLALDSAGNLYIADTDYNAVRMVNASTGLITRVAGNLGYGFSGDGGNALDAAVQNPTSLAIDSAGNLYIGTPSAGRVRKVMAKTGVITTVAGNNTYGGYSGDGGLATSAEVSPICIAVDQAGNLFISSPRVIREVSAATGVITRVVGNGYYGFQGDGGSATLAELSYPKGIAFDQIGNLYIADTYNYRIREVSFLPSAAAPLLNIAGGTYSTTQSVTLTDSTSGSIIYYTTNGTTPTISSTKYTAPIKVASTETIEAIAVAPGYANSPIAESDYTISAATLMVTLSPASLNFPSTTVGVTSAAQVLTLKNTGTSAVKLGAVSFTGTNASSFLQSATNCPGTLAAGANCTISIEFNPTAAGTLSATYNLTDNAIGSAQTIALSGTAMAASSLTVTLYPASLAFSSTAVGTSSSAQILTLKNTGTTTVKLGAVSFTGTNASSFLQSATNCPGTLAAGANCTISIEFKPTASGSLTATYSLADSAIGSPQMIALNGTGTAAPTSAVTLSPATLTFPSTTVGSTSAVQTITLKNSGTTAVKLGSVSFTGTYASSFLQSATNCPGTVAAGASCTINLEFKPTVAGDLLAFYNLTDNSTGSPQTVSLNGVAIAASPMIFSPTSLTFFSTKVGATSASQVVTLKNMGATAVILGKVSFTGTNGGSFLQSATNCPGTVVAGASCTINMEFKPTVAGNLSANYNLADNATGSPQTVVLSGTATAP